MAYQFNIKSSNIRTITEAAHTKVAGQWIRGNKVVGNTASLSNSEVQGVVTEIINSTSYKIQTSGLWVKNGLVGSAGDVIYLQDDGTISNTPSTTVNKELGIRTEDGLDIDIKIGIDLSAAPGDNGWCPVGTVLNHAGSTLPSGFLWADGSTISRTTYADLFAAIGTTYGSGDGSTTFKLPDLRGMYIRGAGTNGTRTKASGAYFNGGNLGDYVTDQVQGHRHSVNLYDRTGSGVIPSNGGSFVGLNTSSILDPITDGVNGTPRVGDETRPASISLNPIIKATATSSTGHVVKVNSLVQTQRPYLNFTGDITVTDDPGNNMTTVQVNGVTSTPATTDYKIVSGLVNASYAPAFLTVTGSDAIVTLNASLSNPFECYINGTHMYLYNNVNSSSLTLAPASNNTALINDAYYTSQVSTKTEGEFGDTWITIDTEGSSVTALNGTKVGFKTGSTEYFIGDLDTTNHKITNVIRGDAGSARLSLADNAVLTLMNVNYIFLGLDNLLYATTIVPIYSYTNPTVNNGAYYFNLSDKKWYLCTAGVWAVTNKILIGHVYCDSANSKAAQSYDFAYSWDNTNDYSIRYKDAATIQVNIRNLAVANKVIQMPDGFYTDVTWSALDTGAEASSTLYYLYVKPTGQIELSITAPRKKAARKGLYKRDSYARCIGTIYNDGSSNIFMHKLAGDIYNYLGDGAYVESQNATTSYARYSFSSIPPIAKITVAEVYNDCQTGSWNSVYMRVRGATNHYKNEGNGYGSNALILYSEIPFQNSTIEMKKGQSVDGYIYISGYKADF